MDDISAKIRVWSHANHLLQQDIPSSHLQWWRRERKGGEKGRERQRERDGEEKGERWGRKKRGVGGERKRVKGREKWGRLDAGCSVREGWGRGLICK